MELKMWMNGLAVSAWILLASVASPMEAAVADNVVLDGIYVADFNPGGLTGEEAGQRVDEYVGSMANQAATLNMDGTVVNTAAGELDFRWGNTNVVAEATQQYGGGSLIRHYMNLEDLQMNPVTLELGAALDDGMTALFMGTKCDTATTEAKDASITRENGAFVITPEIVGETVDTDATRQALSEALDSGLNAPIVVAAVVEEKLPAATVDQLTMIQDVLSTFSTDFSSSGASHSTNLEVGSGKINGRVLTPGETLSGYECMQPSTTASGYATAAAYENRQVADSVDDGVCQITTALYNTALLAGLEIIRRQNHSMIVGYAKPPNDAAVIRTYKDTEIMNPYDTPIYVEGGTNGRTLFFTFYGKETRPSNYTIKYVSETLSVTDPGEPIIKVDPSLAPGARVQEQSAYRGLKSRLWKYVYMDGMKAEKTILRTDTYNAFKTITRVGPEAPASMEPTEVPADMPAESIPSFVTGENGEPDMPAPQQEPSSSPGGPEAQYMRKIIWGNHGIIKSEQDLIIAGYIGQEGARIIACAREEELRRWSSKDYIEQIKTNRSVETLAGNLEQWCESGTAEYEPIGEGGVYTALWNLSEAYEVRIEFQLLQILIRQEAMEVYERYNVNPYWLYPEDCVLLVTGNDGHPVKALEEKGISAVVTDRVNPGIKQGILHGRSGAVSPDGMERERRGYLGHPARDELYEVIPGCLLYRK